MLPAPNATAGTEKQMRSTAQGRKRPIDGRVEAIVREFKQRIPGLSDSTCNKY